MSHFGDLEAHCRVLEEVRGSDSAKLLTACLRAVAMSAFGSFHGLDSMDETLTSRRHVDESPSLRAILSVASLTASFSQGLRGLHKELAQCAATLDGELSRIAYAREQVAQGATVRSVNVSFGAAVATVQIGGSNGNSSSHDGSSTSAVRDAHAKLDAQCELTVYMQAYLQFIRGFLELWDELFGAHYSFPTSVIKTGLESRPPTGHRGGEEEDGGESHEADEHVGPPPFSHNCVPPHLYAVNWKCVLTPGRREWIEGQHEVTRELLFRIVARELPLEAYLLYQLYAIMTLRLRLLEAVAQLFVWSSCYLDVMVCVQQLYTNYRLQCEVACLQDLWASFKLFDAEFLHECEVFNSSCSEDQGAVIEHMFFDTSNLAAASARAEAASSLGMASRGSDGATSRNLSREPSRVVAPASEEFQASSGDDSASVGSSHSANEGTGASSIAAGTRTNGTTTRREFYTPLFPTRCHFTWLLQRACWSMYGRSSLLFSSCLHAERIYDSAPLLRAPPTIAELAGGDTTATATTVTTSHRASRLDASKASKNTVSQKCPRAANEESSQGTRQTTNTGTAVSATSPKGSALPQSSSRVSPSPVEPAQARAAPGRSDAQTPRTAGTSTAAALSSANQQPQGRQATHSQSGWRGVWQSLLHHDRRQPHNGTGRPDATSTSVSAAAAAAAGTGGGGETPLWEGSAPQPSSSRVSQSVSASLYDSQSNPVVDGVAPFFFRYRVNQADLEDATATNAAEAGAATERDETNDAPLSLAVETEASAAPPSIDYVFLKRCGCYVLALAIRKALEAQRYPATLIVVTDNSTREGRVHWRQNRVIPLAVKDETSERMGIAPWVLNFVFPGSRLSSDAVVRSQQERRLFQTVVFQVAGTDSPRVCFPAYNSLFFALNSGPLFDSGRLYFVLHLSMSDAEAHACHSGRHPAADTVCDAAYGGLEEICQAWAMNCTCTEALRLLPTGSVK